MFLLKTLTLRRRMPHICSFLDCFSFSHFQDTLCHFQNAGLSSLNSGLNFGKNLRVQRNWLRFFKNFKKQCALQGLMKLKLLRETLLLTIFLHQKVRKDQRMTKRPPFEITRGFLTWLLTLRRRMPHMCGFLDCFSFSHFLAFSCGFQNVGLSSLNFQVKFLKFQMYQYSEIGCVFSKILKNSARSKG